jgi:uncharacterized RDD family membrane protein YckC
MVPTGFDFDDDLVIETPEHIELTFALASVGNRFLASLIDHILQTLAIVIILFFAFLILTGGATLTTLTETLGVSWTIAITIIVSFLVYFGYFAFFEILWSGQTPGKRWLKLRVVRTDGRPISPFEAIGRNLMRSFDFLPGGYGFGVLSIILSKNSQRLGDFVVGTVVVKERASEAPTLIEVLNMHEREMSQQPKLALNHLINPRQLKEEEWLTVETFLRRRDDLPTEVREKIATHIALPLMQKLQLTDISANSSNYEDILEAIDQAYKAHAKYYI